tara:strand:- start:127 stop:918 length:792 start_codon:yes stop_codon:yes gene_type:complete
MLTLLSCGQGQNTNYLLDLFPNPRVAFSLQKLKPTTTYVVRVRRSSDNLEQNFSPEQITNGTLTTFCGSGIGFVTVWYGQNSNNDNVSNSEASKQPKIVVDGNLVMQGGKASILFKDSLLFNATITISQPMITFSVIKLDVNDGTNQYYMANTSGSLTVTGKFQQNWGNFFGSGLVGTIVNTNNNLQTLIVNSTTSELFINNVSNTSGDIGTRDFNGFVIGSGIGGSGSYWNGKIQELIIYPNSQIFNRNAINTEINKYYKIY